MTSPSDADDSAWREQLAVGSVVRHRFLGEGPVVAMSPPGDRATVTVDFPAPVGRKVLKVGQTTLTIVTASPGAARES